ncbi:MAG TPA: hypothetical protein VFI38_11450 [Candidatus Acidoferrum sp.]|nr:hypothetical protein [Candidatus Acidoferrum sp.]
MLRIEICLATAAILGAFAFPHFGSRWFERIESSFGRFAQRRALSVLAVGILAAVARLAVLPILPVPTPAIHDEFSYLLMSDTFAHGRLANPTHPMWTHFETFQVNQVPTYVSKYYPAQGVFLAIGQVVFGHPFWGVLLSSALMCAAICWMLQGWMPPAWALLGGILAVIRLGTFSYWANSYWGGAVAALGGALVLGALPRIKEKPQVRDAVWMGIGLALLFNSRPFESLFLAVPIAIALLVWLLKKDERRTQTKLLRVILPLGIIVTVSFAAMALYFWKTTGHPFQPPYLVYERAYMSAPSFPWMPPKALPSYGSAAMRDFYSGDPVGAFEFARQHPLSHFSLRIFLFWLFYLGPMLTVPFLILLLALPVGTKLSDFPSALRFLLLVAGASFFGMLLPVIFLAHYAAPITALVYAFVLWTMRYIRPLLFMGKPAGIGINRAVIVFCVLLAVVRIAAPISGIALTRPKLTSWASENYKFPERPAIISALDQKGGSHLVFVGNGPVQRSDWVYNAADIDASKIVWARDLGPAKNQELIKYFRSRKVWILDPNGNTPTLIPYPASPIAQKR